MPKRLAWIFVGVYCLALALIVAFVYSDYAGHMSGILILCAALAFLPYLAAFLLFEAATLALFLAVACRIVGDRSRTTLLVVLAFPMVFWTAGLGCRCKIDLCRLHAFGDRDGKVQRLEAEAGIEVMCGGGALELQFEEARDMLGAARRHGQPDIDCLDLAINVVERKPQGTRPYAIAHQSMNEILHQASRNRDDDLLRKNRFKQIAQAVIDRRGSDGGKRLVYTAERLV